MILRIKYVFSFLLLSTLLANCQLIENKKNQFKLGADVLIEEQLDLLKDKKVGLVINHTSLLSNRTHLLDTLLSSGITVSVVFTPEHGLYGKLERGEKVDDSKVYDIPVYSLHGKVKKPTDEMLANIDLIIYDLQDLGVRFYTYISTLFYALEAAVENNIPLIVLDRLNPNAGAKVSGPVLNEKFKSFLGLSEIPVTYGLTAGELAQLYLHEFIPGTNSLLTVIKIENWNRNMSWGETGIEWIPPSPNIPDVETAMVYPGTCFLEGTNISEGRGTEKPFLQIGAPFITSEELLNEMKKYYDGTYELRQISFTPKSIKGKAENPKYENEICNGISITILNRQQFDAVGFGVKLIYVLHKLYPEKFEFYKEHFDKLAGTSQIRKMILENKSPDYIIDSWEKELNKFKSIREKYLLY